VHTDLTNHLETAAKRLWADLTERAIPGLVGTGVRNTTGEIVVYVAQLNASALIPTTWEGYRVTVQRMTGLKPA
jgi:hypothetical protein